MLRTTFSVILTGSFYTCYVGDGRLSAELKKAVEVQQAARDAALENRFLRAMLQLHNVSRMEIRVYLPNPPLHPRETLGALAHPQIRIL